MLGIPFLMFLRTSIFFEKANAFVIPFRSFESIEQNGDILFLVWLIIFWFVFRARTEDHFARYQRSNLNGRSFNVLDYAIASLVAITLIGLGTVLNEHIILDKAYDKFISLLSMFLGFFIIKDIAWRTEAIVLKDFLFNIVLVNTLASALYFIHQGLHVNLYTSDITKEYLITIVNGVIITRTFWFMPVLWFFSIAFILGIKRKKNIFDFFLLAVNVLGVYISYTRSFLMIAILLIILYFLLIGLKDRNFGKSVRSLVLAVIAAVALFFMATSFLPASTNYFLSRFQELDERPSSAEPNNLVFRFYQTGNVLNRMDTKNLLFGYGPITEIQSPLIKIVEDASADMGWAEVIFRWGFLGILLFALLYISSIIKAFLLFMKTDGIVSQLSLLLFLTIISQVIEGFISFSIMSPNRLPLALWYFGILSGLISKNSYSQIIANKDYATKE